CLLFTNAKKNILCEKPLAMNTKEVKEILASAKKNNVFLMEAVWTRFFPASVEIRKLLAQGEMGEVKMVRADFGVPLLHVPRAVQKDLGGGALLDLGIYCLQFITMVFNGEKPEAIQASGVCLETGNKFIGWFYLITFEGENTPDALQCVSAAKQYALLIGYVCDIYF
ncbi:PREDICTED: trans-1,2-dihydrobenzene-1,2-diol dehydrogenase-like, partial [Cyprinodon variegatus]|uniref:trans-1,2-dihydrobenzene-1,2-diol dehydrogenase-like n=1 Tax=Cyprinodon variegatus TaxID=28743 RepID=UPI0007425FCE